MKIIEAPIEDIKKLHKPYIQDNIWHFGYQAIELGQLASFDEELRLSIEREFNGIEKIKKLNLLKLAKDNDPKDKFLYIMNGNYLCELKPDKVIINTDKKFKGGLLYTPTLELEEISDLAVLKEDEAKILDVISRSDLKYNKDLNLYLVN